MFPRVPHSVITVISRALFFSLGCMILLLVRCEREDWLSPDYGREELLPDRDDYLNEDYGTQLLANELAGVYAAEIGLVYYDAETRTIPQLYLTRGEKEIRVDSLSNGAVYVYFDKFNTAFMPLLPAWDNSGFGFRANLLFFIHREGREKVPLLNQVFLNGVLYLNETRTNGTKPSEL